MDDSFFKTIPNPQFSPKPKRPLKLVCEDLLMKARRGDGDLYDETLSHIIRLERVIFDAYDCLGDVEDMRAILAEVCDPHLPQLEETDG